VLFLIGLFFILQLTQSCSTCSEEPTYFDSNLIKIKNLDNSGLYTHTINIDTMFSAAVAFELAIYDSTNTFYTSLVKPKTSFGFSTAKALSPCPRIYQSKQNIDKISIITLEAISPEIPVNTDVTACFLTQERNTFLFQPLETLLNTGLYSYNLYDPLFSFNVFFKKDILNDKAQFAFEILLSDGRTLKSQTNLIHLKQSFNE
jgi:hypothetical protein